MAHTNHIHYHPHEPAYYQPPLSAPPFPPANLSDPASFFDQPYLPPTGRQQSLPFPALYSDDLPSLDDVDASSIFRSEQADYYAAAPASPAASFGSDIAEFELSGASFRSATSSSTSSSASTASSPFSPSSADESCAQTGGDESPFRLPALTSDSDDAQQPPVLSPALLQSLSFDPQQLLAQLSSDLFTQPSSPPEPKRRQRIAGLTSQQRAALKRQKHRAIDTQRRHREQAAMGKLHALVYQNAAVGDKKKGGGSEGGRASKKLRGEWLDEAGNEGSDNESDDEDGEDGEKEGEDSAKKDKVTILEHSARRLEQMQAVIHQLAAACTASQQANRQLLTQLSPSSDDTTQAPYQAPRHSPRHGSQHLLSLFRSSVAQQLDANVGQQSLYASMFLSASSAIFAVRALTGTVCMINERMLEDSGWQRQHVQGRLMTVPYEWQVADDKAEHDARGHYGDAATHARISSNRVLVAGKGGALVPANNNSQYPRSLQLMRQLYLGERTQIQAVWRQQMRDGQLYEASCTSWISGHTEVVDERTGAVVQRPDVVVFVCDRLHRLGID